MENFTTTDFGYVGTLRGIPVEVRQHTDFLGNEGWAVFPSGKAAKPLSYSTPETAVAMVEADLGVASVAIAGAG